MVVTIYLDTGSSDEECDDDDVIMVVHPDSDPLRSVDLVELEPGAQGGDCSQSSDPSHNVDLVEPEPGSQGGDFSSQSSDPSHNVDLVDPEPGAQGGDFSSSSSDPSYNVDLVEPEPGAQGGDFSSVNSQISDDLEMQSDSNISEQSWRSAWDRGATEIERGMLPDPTWGIPPSQPPDGGGPHLPGVTDREVITVFFEHTLRVEMRFNPGMRYGIPNTQVRSSHWSLVHCNF